MNPWVRKFGRLRKLLDLQRDRNSVPTGVETISLTRANRESTSTDEAQRLRRPGLRPVAARAP
jgi:hypothetical protein